MRLFLFTERISIPVYLVMLLITWPSLLFNKTPVRNFGEIKLYSSITKHSWKNRIRLLGYVISGKVSLVGSPIYSSASGQVAKKGVTGIIQVNGSRIQIPEESENFALYYLQNYSVWMDIDIILKTIFNRPCPLDLLEEKVKAKV